MTPQPEFTIAEAEDLLLKCAAFVDKFGPVAQPWLDRAEREYEKLKNNTSATDRIKRMLGKK